MFSRTVPLQHDCYDQLPHLRGQDIAPKQAFGSSLEMHEDLFAFAHSRADDCDFMSQMHPEPCDSFQCQNYYNYGGEQQLATAENTPAILYSKVCIDMDEPAPSKQFHDFDFDLPRLETAKSMLLDERMSALTPSPQFTTH